MQTLDENFADISGLHVAFEVIVKSASVSLYHQCTHAMLQCQAFLHWENKQALQEDLLTGFDNPNQTFFLSFAQVSEKAIILITL